LAVSAPFLAAYARVDSVLLMKMQGAESVGYYGAAYAFFMAFGGLGSSVQSALFPVLAKTYAESPEKARALFNRGLRWMVALGVAGAAGTFLVGRKVLTLVYGASFEVAGPAFEVLMAGSIFLLLNNTYGMTINAVGRQKKALLITVGGLTTNVLVNLVLIPRYDFIGAAWATLITEAAVLVMCHVCLAPAWSRNIGSAID
jgi:O-antigen/teichoic acid export membrane protein